MDVRRVFETVLALKVESKSARRHAAPPLPATTARLGGHTMFLTHDAVLGATEGA